MGISGEFLKDCGVPFQERESSLKLSSFTGNSLNTSREIEVGIDFGTGVESEKITLVKYDSKKCDYDVLIGFPEMAKLGMKINTESLSFDVKGVIYKIFSKLERKTLVVNSVEISKQIPLRVFKLVPTDSVTFKRGDEFQVVSKISQPEGIDPGDVFKFQFSQPLQEAGFEIADNIVSAFPLQGKRGNPLCTAVYLRYPKDAVEPFFS